MSRGNAEESDLSDEEARRQKILSIWSSSPPAPRQVRGPAVVNALALCGVVIGFAAVFCPWFRWDYSVGTWSTSLWEILTSEWFAVNRFVDLGGLLFVSATIAALFTQVSGSVQIASLAMIFTDVADRAEMGIGFYMGVFSAAIILASAAFPLGPGFEAGPYTLRNRLIVIGHKPSQPEKQGVKGEQSQRLRLRRLFRTNGKWISLLVAVSIWSVTVVSYENDFFRDDPLLLQIPGGVSIESDALGPGLSAFPWTGCQLTLGNGESIVGWNFSNPELTSGAWCAVNLGYRNLETLNVSLTAVNIGGDPEGWGLFGPGDQLALVAQNDTSFEEGVVYSILWKVTYGLIVWTGIEISFMFNDGNLDSWVSQERFGAL